MDGVEIFSRVQGYYCEKFVKGGQQMSMLCSLIEVLTIFMDSIAACNTFTILCFGTLKFALLLYKLTDFHFFFNSLLY